MTHSHFLLQRHTSSSSLLSKEREAKREDSPARLRLEFHITTSKTQKQNQVFNRKRPLRASNGLSGSGFRASMIRDIPIVSSLTANRNVLSSTNHLISYRIRLLDTPHILVRTLFWDCHDREHREMFMLNLRLSTECATHLAHAFRTVLLFTCLCVSTRERLAEEVRPDPASSAEQVAFTSVSS